MKKHIPALKGLLCGAILTIFTGNFLFSQQINVTQEWLAQFNGADSLRDMAVAIDASGSIYVSGTTNRDIGGGSTAPFGVLIKYNAQGDEIWTAETSEPEVITAMTLDANSNIFICGGSQDSLGQIYMRTEKYDSLGQKIWEATYPTADARDIQTDSFGNLYIAGATQNTTQFTVLKYSSGGTLLWAQTFNNNNDPNILSIGAKALVVTDASIWVTGNTDNNYLVTINYDATGNVQWSQMYQHAVGDFIDVQDMDRDENNNLYLSTQTEAQITLIKYSPAGTLLSVTQHGSSSSPSAVKVDQRHQDVYMTGRLSGGTRDGVLIKYNYSGVEQWASTLAKSLPGTGAPTLAIDTAGNIYTTQTTYTGILSPNNANYITHRFSPAGDKQWEITFNGPANRADNAIAVAADNRGSVYVTGGSFNSTSNFDIVTIKYSQEILGATCATSIVLASEDSINTTMTDSVMWFSFTADSTHERLSATVEGIISLTIYSGTCSGLTVFASETADPGDSTLVIENTGFTIGNEYFAKVAATVSGNKSMNNSVTAAGKNLAVSLKALPSCPYFTCKICEGTVVVDENVTVDFNTNPPTYTGDADLLPYFTYDNSGSTADTWNAIFNVGANKIEVLNGATITTSLVGVGNSQYAPGIIIQGTCDLEVENGGHIIVNSANKNAGDLLIEVSGDITVDGEIRNEISGTVGLPGAITVASKCGNIIVGETGLIADMGKVPGGRDITLVTCGENGVCGGGDITVSGLVKSMAYGQPLAENLPNIKVVSMQGVVTINANTAEPLYDEYNESGTKFDIYGGLLSWTRNNVQPGKVEVQAKGDITVNGHGIDPSTPVRKSFGAIAAIGTAINTPGGVVDVRSLEGNIIGNDRAFDVSGRNRLPVNYANLSLFAKLDISLNRLGTDNNFNPVVDASSPGVGDKGGKNELRSFSGSITIGTNALVSASVPTGAGTVQGVNLLTSCTGVTNNGAVTPADLNSSDDIGTCSPEAPVALFTSCEELADFSGRDGNPPSSAVITAPDRLNVSVFPNPSNGIFTIEFIPAIADAPVQLSIEDMLGRQLYTAQLSGGPVSQQINLQDGISSNKAGIYFVKVINGDEQYIQKINIVK